MFRALQKTDLQQEGLSQKHQGSNAVRHIEGNLMLFFFKLQQLPTHVKLKIDDFRR